MITNWQILCPFKFASVDNESVPMLCISKSDQFDVPISIDSNRVEISLRVKPHPRYLFASHSRRLTSNGRPKGQIVTINPRLFSRRTASSGLSDCENIRTNRPRCAPTLVRLNRRRTFGDKISGSIKTCRRNVGPNCDK